jgi:hypothetical protein
MFPVVLSSIVESIDCRVAIERRFLDSLFSAIDRSLSVELSSKETFAHICILSKSLSKLDNDILGLIFDRFQNVSDERYMRNQCIFYVQLAIHCGKEEIIVNRFLDLSSDGFTKADRLQCQFVLKSLSYLICSKGVPTQTLSIALNLQDNIDKNLFRDVTGVIAASFLKTSRDLVADKLSVGALAEVFGHFPDLLNYSKLVLVCSDVTERVQLDSPLFSLYTSFFRAYILQNDIDHDALLNGLSTFLLHSLDKRRTDLILVRF